MLVATDSKAAAKALDKHLQDKGHCGGLITADAPGAEREAFFQAPNETPKRNGWGYLIYSPAIAAGVSITSDYFHCVFGLYTGVVAPADFSQMLFRHRRAKEWTLAISAQAPGQNYNAAENRAALEALDQQQHGDEKRQLDDVSVFVNAVQAREREDKAWYALKLLVLLEGFGLSIERVSLDGSALEEQAAELKDARDAVKKAGAKAILSARQLNEYEARYLRQRDDLPEDDLHALARHRVCAVLTLPDPSHLTDDDIAFVDRHKNPSKVIDRFDAMRRAAYHVAEHDRDQPAATRAFLASCRAFFRDALKALGVDLVDGSGEWSKQDPAVNLPPVFEAHPAVVTKLGLQLAPERITRTVASILERIGLRAENVGTRRSGRYQIRPNDWDRMVRYSTWRAGERGVPGEADSAQRAFAGVHVIEGDADGFFDDEPPGDPIPGWLRDVLAKDGAVLLVVDEIARRTGCAKETALKRRREAAAVNNRQLYRFDVVATGRERKRQTKATALSFRSDAEGVAENIERTTGRRVVSIASSYWSSFGRFDDVSLKEHKGEVTKTRPVTSPSGPSKRSEQNDASTTSEPSAVESAGARPETSSGRQPDDGPQRSAPIFTLDALQTGAGISGAKATRYANRGEKHRRRLLKDPDTPDPLRNWLTPSSAEQRRLVRIALGATDGDIPAAGQWISELMKEAS